MFWIITGLFTAIADATKDYISKHSMKKIDHYLAAWSLLTLTTPFLFLFLLFTGIPETDLFFWPVALLGSIIYVVSTVLYMKAISISPLSLTLPMLSFTPVFMILTGPLILGEFPSFAGIIGIASIVIGAYVLNIREVKKGLLQPFISLGKEKGTVLMFIVSFLWSFFAVFMKLLVNISNMAFGFFSEYLLSATIFSIFLIMTKRFKLKEIKRNFKKMLGIGFFMSLSEICLSFTYTLTLAVYAIAIKRTSILFGSFYGFKFFKEGNVLQRMLGSAFMLFGVILMVL